VASVLATFAAIILVRGPVHAAQLVPEPLSVQIAGDASCPLAPRARVRADSAQVQPLVAVARNILLTHRTGADVTLELRHDTQLGAEGYRLASTPGGVVISAAQPAGIFYGLQTLDELLPWSGNSMACATIVDTPAYRWRGIMLDTSRHFFPIPVLKRYIDVAAHFKLNVFHLHLDDDQGWRIEIKRYPKLTQIGSCRAQTMLDHDATEFDGKRYCGYYTQAQIRDLVAYAKARFVTIVPEIEMPGHSVAALAAYPQLACSPGPYRVRQTWGESVEIFCPTDYTFNFLENVLREVMALFPSTYIHIGGDEAPKDAWEHSAAVHALMKARHIKTYDGVQGYFDRRIEKFLNANGRRMIGWDEILAGGVTRNATIMSWRGTDGGIAAAKAGNDVVMSPDGPLYFDAYQGDQNDEPDAIGNLSTPEMVYDFDPTAGIPPARKFHVIGVQGNTWTEYIATPDYLFYMVLPRELALSEIAWRDPHPRNDAGFDARMGAQIPWLLAHGYNFRIPNPVFHVDGGGLTFANVSSSVRTVTAQTDAAAVAVTIQTVVPHGTIHYTTDGTAPTAKSPVYSGPLSLSLEPLKKIDIQAVVVLPGGRTSTPSEVILTGTAH
jgi:hexosaminidase